VPPTTCLKGKSKQPRKAFARRNASILSPLRYPGGKRQLAGYIAATIRLNGLRPKLFVEPFAGGASVALVTVRCSMPGCAMTVDGKLRGITNDNGDLLVEGVPQGPRIIAISKQGYLDDNHLVNVNPDAVVQQEVLLTLKVIPAQLSITANVARAYSWTVREARARLRRSRSCSRPARTASKWTCSATRAPRLSWQPRPARR
jgi:hypothetical protein